MSDIVVSFPIDVWKKAKGKEDLQAWILSTRPELESELREQTEESLRYELSYLSFPKQKIPVLLEFSDDEDDMEVICLVPQQGFFAAGSTEEEAKQNLLSSMEDDFMRLKDQRKILGQKLLSKLEFLEKLF